tara:strand:+ start:206 stop:493 length:288 start_codon:yes stop_codon:yes gene_type:complete
MSASASIDILKQDSVTYTYEPVEEDDDDEIPLPPNAIQVRDYEIEDLKTKMRELKEENAKLRQKVAKLEAEQSESKEYIRSCLSSIVNRKSGLEP